VLHLVNRTSRAQSVLIRAVRLTLNGVTATGAVRFDAAMAVQLGAQGAAAVTLSYTVAPNARPGVYVVTLLIDVRGTAPWRVRVPLAVAQSEVP
jgi:hypothetical protein